MSDPHDPYSEPPFNPISHEVIAMVLVVLGIELLFTLGARGLIGGPEAIGWRLAAVQSWSFSDPVWEWMLEHRHFPAEHLARFFTYPFVHLSFTHAVFVIVFLLALGKLVTEAFGGIAFWLIFFVASTVGALAYGVILDDPRPLLGGYPGVYGLIGAYTFILWTNLGSMGENQLRAFSLVGFLLGFQLLFGLLFGGSNDWIADLGGFAAGFLLSFVLAPGGWRRLLDKLRQR